MKVRVKVLTVLADDLHGDRVLEPGQIVEIDEETAKASPWAFEEVKEKDL